MAKKATPKEGSREKTKAKKASAKKAVKNRHQEQGMLDIGGWELLIVAFVLIMVVGPKELPKMLRGLPKLSVRLDQWRLNFRGYADYG